MTRLPEDVADAVRAFVTYSPMKRAALQAIALRCEGFASVAPAAAETLMRLVM